MLKSRYLIIFFAFAACVLLFSFQWRPGSKPATVNNDLSVEGIQITQMNVQQLYESINGKTLDEVEAFCQEVQFEFNRELYRSDNTVQASVYRQSLQTVDSDLYILELHGLVDLYHQYIVVQESGENLTYITTITPGNGTGCNAFRIEEDPASGTVWVVTTELVGRGTGVSQYDEVWYRLEKNSAIKDLQYYVQMHEWMSPSQLVFYQLKGNAVTQRHIDFSAQDTQDYHIEVHYQINFTDSSALGMEDVGDGFLFSAERMLCYVWDNDEKRFHLDPEHSTADQSLFEFSKDGIRKNFRPELSQLEKSGLKIKQDWLRKLKEKDFSELKGPEIVENLTNIDISNLNDEKNTEVILSLPEGFYTRKFKFPKAPNFEYHAEKNKTIDTVYSFEIYNSAQKDKFNLYGIEGYAGWFYDTSYYRNKPDTSRFPSRSTVKSKVYEGQTLLGQGEIFILECDITPKELRTEEFSTYEMIFAWIPIEQEDLAYNLAISVPLGEDSDQYIEMVKNILNCD